MQTNKCLLMDWNSVTEGNKCFQIMENIFFVFLCGLYFIVAWSKQEIFSLQNKFKGGN